MIRLDQLLVDQGWVSSRARAQRVIKEGRVRYLSTQWQTATKPGLRVDPNSAIELLPDPSDRYVSRGALKLEAAFALRPIDLTDKTALDVGQSTGGFTDFLLQQGIRSVVGVEVGSGQLAERLRQDQRVTCLERYNARELGDELRAYAQDGAFDLAVMDVSFISQRLILPRLVPLLSENGYLYTLVKPQFELGPEAIGKGGIVKPNADIKALQETFEQLIRELKLKLLEFSACPIKGGDGNQEYLMICTK